MAENNTAATAGTNPSDDTGRHQVNNPNGLLGKWFPSVFGGQPPVAKQPDLSSTAQVTTATNQGAGGGRGSAASYANYNVDEAKNIVNKQVGGTAAKTYSPRPNPLDDYLSYTYGITLHVLTKDDYNKMVASPFNFTPTKTLISSAGRYGSTDFVSTGPRSFKTVGRDPAFKEDFYFENFKMETVVGLNANTRGTNAITMEFTIVEPYGMTLLDRIMDVNNTGLNGKNYLDMPYLLEINFFGSDDSGKLHKIAEHTKWIPIKLLGMKIKASVKGAEYAIQAVPFNHAANLETVQAIKTRMHISGSTIADYFAGTDKNSSDAAVAAFNEDTQRQEKKAVPAQDLTNQADNSGAGELDSQVNGNPGVREPEKATDKTQSQEPIVVNAKSFVAAYNAWFEAEQKKGSIEFADQIAFKFEDEILNSSIVDAKKNSVRRINETDSNTNAKSKDNDAVTANFDSVVHDLDPGTTINDVINNVIPQSKFFLDQTIDAATGKKESQEKAKDGETIKQQAKPFKMWKTVPTITLGKFDNKRNQWSKTITFNVGTYTAYQTRDDRLPKSPPPNPVKRYDYFYTGHNSSVINFDIDFNALYYTAHEVDRGATSAGAGPKQINQEEQNSDKVSKNKDPRKIDQTVNVSQSGNQSTSAGGATSRPEVLNAKSALQSIYTSSAGDMINLQMQIIGDPEFIKQDDLFISPQVIKSSGIPSDPGNPLVPGTTSIDMDSTEVYCWVTFRTPSDFNDTNGRYNLNSENKYAVSEFSGFYRLITVTSEFRGGKFTQTLNMVRQPDQDPVNVSIARPDVKSSGDTARESKNSQEAVEQQQTDNPAVPDKDVNPAVDASTPDQSNPAIEAARGPDGDGNTTPAPTLAQTNSSILSAITARNSDSAPPNTLASVAKSAPTFSVEENLPLP